MPALARPCSVIPHGDFKGDFEYDYLDNTDFVVYELSDGCTAECTLYDENALEVFTFTAKREGGVIKVSFTETDKSFTVSVSGTDKRYSVMPGSRSITIEL